MNKEIEKLLSYFVRFKTTSFSIPLKDLGVKPSLLLTMKRLGHIDFYIPNRRIEFTKWAYPRSNEIIEISLTKRGEKLIQKLLKEEGGRLK